MSPAADGRRVCPHLLHEGPADRTHGQPQPQGRALCQEQPRETTPGDQVRQGGHVRDAGRGSLAAPSDLQREPHAGQRTRRVCGNPGQPAVPVLQPGVGGEGDPETLAEHVGASGRQGRHGEARQGVEGGGPRPGPPLLLHLPRRPSCLRVHALQSNASSGRQGQADGDMMNSSGRMCRRHASAANGAAGGGGGGGGWRGERWLLSPLCTKCKASTCFKMGNNPPKKQNKDNNNNNSIPKQLQENVFDCLYLQHCTCDAYLYDWTFLAMSALLVERN